MIFIDSKLLPLKLWIRVPYFFFTKLFVSFEPIIGFIKKVNPLKFQALMIKHLVKSL